RVRGKRLEARVCKRYLRQTTPADIEELFALRGHQRHCLLPRQERLAYRGRLWRRERLSPLPLKHLDEGLASPPPRGPGFGQAGQVTLQSSHEVCEARGGQRAGMPWHANQDREHYGFPLTGNALEIDRR